MKSSITLYLCKGLMDKPDYICAFKPMGAVQVVGIAEDVEIEFTPVERNKTEIRERLNKIIEDAQNELEKL